MGQSTWGGRMTFKRGSSSSELWLTTWSAPGTQQAACQLGSPTIVRASLSPHSHVEEGRGVQQKQHSGLVWARFGSRYSDTHSVHAFFSLSFTSRGCARVLCA